MSRTKGAKNRYGAEVKENLVAVFTRLGGTHAMAEWAREHATEFYRMYAQLAPKEVTADVRVLTEVDLTDEQLAAIATGRSEGTAEETGGESEPVGVH